MLSIVKKSVLINLMLLIDSKIIKSEIDNLDLLIDIKSEITIVILSIAIKYS